MATLLGLIDAYGFSVGFLVAFLDAVGAPLMTLPVLIVAGSLAQSGRISAAWTVIGVVLGAVLADFIWYHLGRRHGRRIMTSLCRFTLHSDVCVDRAEDGFRHRVTATVIFARFLPGVTVVMAPLAGVSAVPLITFLLLDLAGTSLYGISGASLGWLFGATVVSEASALQGALQWVLPSGLLGYVGWRLAFQLRLMRRAAASKTTEL